MPIYQAVVLAIVQGLTEFLPISSTAHLILVPWALGWKDPGLAFDVAVHGGTLTAVLVYFYRDWMGLLGAVVGWGTPHEIRRNRRFLLLLMVATLPGAGAGYAFKSLAETEFRHPFLIAAMLIVIALFMWQGDRRKDLNRDLESISLTDALVIGAAQALAIVPGVSRVGVTITAGLFLRFRRPAAARFSFLLAAPLIGGAVLNTGFDVARRGLPDLTWAPTMVGVVVSAVVGYLVIFWLLGYLQRKSFRIFVIYRLALGMIVFTLGWGLRHHLR